MNFNEILSANIDFLLPLLPFVVGACVWVVVFRFCLSLFSRDGKHRANDSCASSKPSKSDNSSSDGDFLAGLLTGWFWFK